MRTREALIEPGRAGPGACDGCFLPLASCLCALIPTVHTRTRIFVIRHQKETYKTSNTARLAVRALQNSEMRTYGGKDEPFDESVLEHPGTWLLYPEGDTALPAEPPAQLVVLDGSWAQARRMTQRLPGLRRLPRYSLPAPPPSAARLRRPPIEGGMSTLEAIAHAVARLESPEVAQPLFTLHDEQCRRILSLRGLLHPETGARMFPEPQRPIRKQIR